MNSCCQPSRRTLLKSAACGFGYLALAGMNASAATVGQTHFPARAKRVIFLFMHGGVSQMDSFDYKPRLVQDAGQPLPFELPGLIRPDRLGKIYAPRWKFAQHGDSGQWVSELFPHLAKQIDKLALIKSLHTEGEAHGEAVLRLHTGEAGFVRPSVGSWLSFGLGTENENLPSFVCVDYPTEHGGVRLYGNSFLPAAHQGTQVKLATTPQRQPQIRFLENDYLKASRQREQVDAITALSRQHVEQTGPDPRLEGSLSRMNSRFACSVWRPM